MACIHQGFSFSYVDQLPMLQDALHSLQSRKHAKNVAHADSLYVSICGNGLDTHEIIGSRLISMLVSCGSVTLAQQIFDRSDRCRDELAWNELVQGYARLGHYREALELVRKMEEVNCIGLRRCTCLALLSVCVEVRDIEIGWETHALAVKHGYGDDVFVGSSLIDMYAKLGFLSEAQEVCQGIGSNRNVVAWNALVSGLAQFGKCREVVESLGTMQNEGIVPDRVTFISSLRASTIAEDLEMGKNLHMCIVAFGFETDVVIGNTLVSSYAKCGSFTDARHLLTRKLSQDVVPWTALITGYTECGMGEEALRCYEEMQYHGVSPDAITLLCGLKACGSTGMIQIGYKLHLEMVKEGLEIDHFLGNALVDMYAKCYQMVEAYQVFVGLPFRDVVSWNSLIALYADQGLLEEALACLEQMEISGTVSPNAMSYVHTVRACIRGVLPLCKGMEFHCRITLHGYESDTFVSNALMDMYAKYGLLEDCQYVFYNILDRDVVSWNALITAYAVLGLCEDMVKCFLEMKLEGWALDAITSVNMIKGFSVKGTLTGDALEMHAEIVKIGIEEDVIVANTLVDMYATCGAIIEAWNVLTKLKTQSTITWNALLSGYVECGMMEETLECYSHMRHSKELIPDAITFLCVLVACGGLGSIANGSEVHAEIVKKGFDEDNFISNGLIDMYGKCGQMAEAQAVFDAMADKDIVSWNSLITGYASGGECEIVLNLAVELLKDNRVKLDEVTFLSLLLVCSHGGLLDQCQHLFNAMNRVYGISVSKRHHNCMLDLLGRAGRIGEAMAALELSPCEPDHVAWNTILGASQKWLSCLEFGHHAFDQFTAQEFTHPAALVMLSNLCMESNL